ncbi:unnamed protein product [Lampetra fluviatilis]
MKIAILKLDCLKRTANTLHCLVLIYSIEGMGARRADIVAILDGACRYGLVNAALMLLLSAAFSYLASCATGG